MAQEFAIFVLSTESESGQIGKHNLQPWRQLDIAEQIEISGVCPTFLNMNASSSQIGLIPFPGMVLVLNFFLTVSAGSPYISTSTYVPVFRSVKN